MNRIKRNNNKVKVVLFLLLAVAGVARAQTFQPYKSGVIAYHGYSYPIVPGTDEWKSISTTLQAFLQTGKCTNANDLDYIYSKAKKP